MRGRQSGVSRIVVGVGIVVLVLLLGVGGAAVAKVGPFASSGSTASGGGAGASGISKPTDGKQAVGDAVGRTANFKDVKYTLTYTYSSATIPKIDSVTQVSGTKSPMVVYNQSTDNAGKKFETILNGANNVFCTRPEGSPAQRFPNQKLTPDFADPFSGLVTAGLNWKFLDDVDLSGHKAWHLMSDVSQAITGPNPNNIKVDVNTTEVWIDSRSGKIEKRLDHQTGTENAVKYERTTTDTGFVYDTGVTIPACT